MIERHPENEGYFIFLKPTETSGTKAVSGRGRSQRIFVDPDEHPDIVRDLDEFVERIETETEGVLE